MVKIGFDQGYLLFPSPLQRWVCKPPHMGHTWSTLILIVTGSSGVYPVDYQNPEPQTAEV